MTEENDNPLQLEGRIEKSDYYWKTSVNAIRRSHTTTLFVYNYSI